MCVIVAKPMGVEVDLDTLEACWDTNSDGAGIAYAMDGKVHLYKGIMKWRAFKNVFVHPEIWKDTAAIFHFRIRTHGATDEDNTHPFWVIPGKLAFAHNGIMSGMARKSRSDLSDTQCFNRYILQQLPHNFMRNQGIVELICHAIGGRNKLAFLDSAGEINIFNKDQGEEEESGLWFSNTNHVKKSYGYGYGGAKYGSANYSWRSNGGRSGAAYGHTKPSHKPPTKGTTTPPRKSYPESIVPSSVLPKTPTPVTEIPVNGTDSDDVAGAIAALNTGRIAFEDALDDWYCHDCCVWFDEQESTSDWGDPIPTCPSCGTNAMVTWGMRDHSSTDDSAKAHN